MSNQGWKRIEQGETVRVGYLRAHDETVVLPDGTRDSFAILETPDAVTVVLVGEDGKICLNYEYAYPADDRQHRPQDPQRDGWLLKFPGGGFRPDQETPEQAVSREVQEETSKLVGKLTLLACVTNYFPRSNGRDYKYVAEVAGDGVMQRDAGEQNMRQEHYTVEEIDQLVLERDPRVLHSHFLDTWLLYKTYLSEQRN